MSELLRVVQSYRARAYHCADGTEDGYAPGEDSPQRHGGNQGLSQASESSSETGLSLISGEGGEDWPQEAQKAQKAQEDSTQRRGGRGEEEEKPQGTQRGNRGLAQASESSSETCLSPSASAGEEDKQPQGEWEFVNPLEVERSPIVAAYMKKHGIALPVVPEEHIHLWKAWVTKQRHVSPQRHGENRGLSQASESSSLSSILSSVVSTKEEASATDGETGLSLISGEDSLKAGLRTGDALKGALRTGCTYHSSDYAPQDWVISVTELLRTVQFFNTPGGYESCDYGEDCYCPVVE